MTDELRLLFEHATACWVSENSEVCSVGYLMAGDKRRSLYYKARAAVLYDRARNELLKPPQSVAYEFAAFIAPKG